MKSISSYDHYFKSPMAQLTAQKTLKRKAPSSITTGKRRIPRYETVVPALYESYEIKELNSDEGKRCRIKFGARFTQHLWLHSHYGLSRSESKGTIYIKFQSKDEKDKAINDYCNMVSRYAYDAYAFVSENVEGPLGIKEEVILVVVGGASSFGHVQEKVFFPSKYTKYFRKNYDGPIQDANVKTFVDKTGNSPWLATMEIDTIDLRFNERENTLYIFPFCNVADLTWIFKGQSTDTFSDAAEEAKEEYKKKLAGFINQYEYQQAKDQAQEAQLSPTEEYSTEDSENPEAVLPSGSVKNLRIEIPPQPTPGVISSNPSPTPVPYPPTPLPYPPTPTSSPTKPKSKAKSKRGRPAKKKLDLEASEE